MEHYQSIAKSMEELKMPLVKVAVIAVIAHLIILALGIFLNLQKEDRKYSTMEACMYGMNSVFNNNPNIELVDKTVIKDTKDHSFKVEKATLIKVIDSYTCDVIAKDLKGHRSYRVSLEKNTSFKYQYKIINVSGQKIVSKYQWRNL